LIQDLQEAKGLLEELGEKVKTGNRKTEEQKTRERD
jgi:hypothetical protein